MKKWAVLRIRHFYGVIGTILLSLAGPVLALQTDANQPMNFIADDVSFNDNNGTTVYTGHVSMNQGSTHLTADKVIVYKDKEGSMNKAVAMGKPAHYTTLPDNQKKPMDAFGDTIAYYPQQQRAIIMGNGNVIQAMNSLQGPRIIYDMVKQTVTSFPATLGGEKSLLILQPRDLPSKGT